jgi:L-asparagine transporter-like permease
MKYRRFLFLSLLAIVLIFPIVSLADSGAQLVPIENYESGDYQIKDFEAMGIFIARAILGLSGTFALAMFVFGGIQMITAAGNSESFKKGQQTLINALIGLVIIFCSYIIIRFVLDLVGAEEWTRGKIDQVIQVDN